MAYNTGAGLDDSFAIIRNSIESGDKLSIDLAQFAAMDTTEEEDSSNSIVKDDSNGNLAKEHPKEEQPQEPKEEMNNNEPAAPSLGIEFLNQAKAANEEISRRAPRRGSFSDSRRSRSNSRGRRKSIQEEDHEPRRMVRRAKSGDNLEFASLGTSGHGVKNPEFERQAPRRTKSSSEDTLRSSRHGTKTETDKSDVGGDLRRSSHGSTRSGLRTSMHSRARSHPSELGEDLRRSNHSNASSGSRTSMHSRARFQPSELGENITKAAAEASIEFDSDDSDIEEPVVGQSNQQNTIVIIVEGSNESTDQGGNDQKHKEDSSAVQKETGTTREGDDDARARPRSRSRGRTQRRTSSSDGDELRHSRRRSLSASLHGDNSTRGPKNQDHSSSDSSRRTSTSKSRGTSVGSSRRSSRSSRSLSRSRHGTTPSSGGGSQRGVRKTVSASADIFELAKLAQKAKRDAKKDGSSELINASGTRTGDRDLRALVKTAKEHRKERKSKRRPGQRSSGGQSGKESEKPDGELKSSEEELKRSDKGKSNPEGGHAHESMKRGVIDEIKNHSKDSIDDQKNKNMASVILKNAVASRSKWGGVKSGMNFIHKMKNSAKESETNSGMNDTKQIESGQVATSKWGGVKSSFEFINRTKGILKDKKSKNDVEMQRFAEVVLSADLLKQRAEALVKEGESKNQKKPHYLEEETGANDLFDVVPHPEPLSVEARSLRRGSAEESQYREPESLGATESVKQEEFVDIVASSKFVHNEEDDTAGITTNSTVDDSIEKLTNISPIASPSKTSIENSRPTSRPEERKEASKEITEIDTMPSIMTQESKQIVKDPHDIEKVGSQKDKDDASCSSTESEDELDMPIFLSPLKCVQLRIQPDQPVKKELSIAVHALSRSEDDEDDGADILLIDNEGIEREAYDAWRQQGAVISLFGTDRKTESSTLLPISFETHEMVNTDRLDLDINLSTEPSLTTADEKVPVEVDSEAPAREYDVIVREIGDSKTRLSRALEELKSLESQIRQEELKLRSAKNHLDKSAKLLAANKVVLKKIDQAGG